MFSVIHNLASTTAQHGMLPSMRRSGVARETLLIVNWSCVARGRTVATQISKLVRTQKTKTASLVHSGQRMSGPQAKTAITSCEIEHQPVWYARALRSKCPSSVGSHDRIAGGVVCGCLFCCVL